jgi:hypothetical protein
MPFQSKSQQRWMFSNHPQMAKRWASETQNIEDLPEHKKRKAKIEALKKISK